ncbi:MAG TPA: hypothetical protein VIC85_15560 [Ktedonobacterales bacterium]
MYLRTSATRSPISRAPVSRTFSRHDAPPSPPPARRQRPHGRLIAIWSIVGVGLAAISGLATVLVTQTLGHASPAPSGVTVSYGDSTALVGWQPVSGATAYRVTLIRTSDMGITEQFVVPASQHMADAQGIWTGEHYEVAVQAADSSGTWGSAAVTAQGQSQPVSRTALNGFLDTENRPAGPVDSNLWDVQFDRSDGNGGAFVNAQLHFHVTSNSISKSPSITGLRARVPMDWSGRTITVHGEVDLKGTTNNWFGVQVMPDSAATDRMQDLAERAFVGYHIPTISLFDDNLGLHLLYAPGDGSMQKDLGVYPNPIGLNNVRDTIDWSFSVSHVTVRVDGKTAFDLNWPAPLTFTHGYLNLMAQAYMARPHLTSCDLPMQDCNVWHLDNWGFDAPAGQVQPLTAAYYATGCAPYPDREKAGWIQYNMCASRDFPNGAMPGTPQSVTIPVTTINHLTAATLVVPVTGMKTVGELLASVNSGPWLKTQFVATDHKTGDSQDYLIPFDPTLLMAGANTVRFEKSGCSACWFQVVNPQIETISSDPYMAPAEPAQPAPLGTWNGGQGGIAAGAVAPAPSGSNMDPSGGTTGTNGADGKGATCSGNTSGSGDKGSTGTSAGDSGGTSTGSGDMGGSTGSGDAGGTSTGTGDKGTSTGSGDTGGTTSGSGETGGTSTGSGDMGGTSTGSGDTGGTSAGSGETGGSSTGSGETGGTSTSSGDKGTSTGSGDMGGSSTGSGDTGGTSAGSGETGGSSTGSGETGGTSTGSGETGGTSMGSGDTGGSTGSGETGGTGSMCSGSTGDQGGTSTGSGDTGGTSAGSGETGGSSTGSGQTGGTSTSSGDKGTSTGSGDMGGSTGSGETGGTTGTGDGPGGTQTGGGLEPPGTAPMTITSMPCTATINGQQVTGFCTGTFNPNTSGAPGTSGNPSVPGA